MLGAIAELHRPAVLAHMPRNDTGTHGSGDKPGGDPGDKMQEWSSLIGIITAIVGNVLIALALNVQRYAHLRLNKERHRNRRRARDAVKRAKSSGPRTSYGATDSGTYGNGYRNGSGASTLTEQDRLAAHDSETEPLTGSFHSAASNDGDSDQEDDKAASSYLKSPYWWLGQVLITLGEMGNFLAYGFAPASIVSPLGVVALISNCIIAPAMFHETFRQRDFWGVVIAVGGVVTVVLSAKQEETKLNPHDVLDHITTLGFEIYLGVTILLIVVLMWASPRYGRRTILIDLGLVGLFGGYTALATKGVSSMLSSTLWRAFTTPVTYVLLFILLVTAVMQIRYVNKSLQRFDSTQVIPIQFVMFTLCVIIGSAVLYRDFERTTAEQAAKFVGGCLLTFFGVFLITSGREQSHGDDDDDVLSDADGVEETIGLVDQDGNAIVPGQDADSTPQSRRSSRISHLNHHGSTKAAVTPQQEGGEVPSVRILGSNGSHAPPAQPEGPVHSNAWRDVGVIPSTPPGRGIRSYSTDSVAVDEPSALDLVPTQSNPVTPLRAVTAPDGSLPPRPSISPTKPGTHHRSRTFISPSPLSSTVTAVVKDAFLRAKDDPRLQKSSLRRIRSSIRAGLFFGDDSDSLHEQAAANASEDSPAGAYDDGLGSDTDQTRRRSRSLSDTLGDFFRVRRVPRREDPGSSDVDDETSAAPSFAAGGYQQQQQSDSTPLLNS